MRRRRATTIRDLQTAIECLPRHTRIAMLEGIRSNEIVVGAYSHDDGICPMLAAHRAGGRTDFIAFARAWDRFALGGERARGWLGFGSARGERARRATARELRVLVTHLEASLLEEDLPTGALALAVTEHQELCRRRQARERPPAEATRPGDRDRARELRRQPGWAWTRVVRRLDDYERALAWVHERSAQEPPVVVADAAAALAASDA